MYDDYIPHSYQNFKDSQEGGQPLWDDILHGN